MAGKEGSGRRDRDADPKANGGKEPKAPNPFRKRFEDYARIIDEKNDKRERLVKASRDVTMQSKKIIFGLHRMNAENKKETVEKAHASCAKVRKDIGNRIAPELTPEEYYKFHRAFSPGLQEYIEARTFLSYCEHGSIISVDDIEAEIGSAVESAQKAKAANAKPDGGASDAAPRFAVDHSDYVLGVADLTGELMRMALGGAAADVAGIHAAMRDLESRMVELSDRHRVGRDMAGKIRVLHQSVAKVERSCYNSTVREAEFPEKGGQKRGGAEAVRAEGEKRRRTAA